MVYCYDYYSSRMWSSFTVLKHLSLLCPPVRFTLSDFFLVCIYVGAAINDKSDNNNEAQRMNCSCWGFVTEQRQSSSSYRRSQHLFLFQHKRTLRLSSPHCFLWTFSPVRARSQTLAKHMRPIVFILAKSSASEVFHYFYRVNILIQVMASKQVQCLHYFLSVNQQKSLRFGRLTVSVPDSSSNV